MIILPLAGLLLFLGPSPQYAPSGRPHAPVGGPPACTGITGTFQKCFTTVENPLSAPMVNATSGFGVCQSDGTGAFSSGTPGACMAMWQGVSAGSNQTARVIFNDSANMGASGPATMIPASTGYIYLPGPAIILEVLSGSGGYVPTSCPGTTAAGQIAEIVVTFSGAAATLTCNLYTSGGTLIGTQTGNDNPAHTGGYPSIVNDTGSNATLRLTKFGVN